MVSRDISKTRIPKIGSPENRGIEQKLESTNNKLLYLIKKINQLSKAQTNLSTNGLTQDRLMRIAERLRKIGLGIEYTDGHGFVKLKAYDQKGLDNLKRLNTLFPVSMIESFLDNVVG